jgi:hypothetical protein
MKSIIDTLAPILSGIALVPILFMVFELFSCVDEYEDSTYLTIDCEEECWTRNHATNFFVGIGVCLIFIPAVAFLRIEWQTY